MTTPQHPLIQFSPLSIAEANAVLEGLKQLPLGVSYDLFTKLHAEADSQVKAAQQAENGQAAAG